MTTTDRYTAIGAASSFIGAGFLIWSLLNETSDNDLIFLGIGTGAALTATFFLGLTAWELRKQDMADASEDEGEA